MSVIIALLVLALLLGAYSTWGGGSWGYYGWSPLGVILAIAIVLFFLGVLR